MPLICRSPQAIARLNRVFGGIADELRDVIQTYTQAGGVGKPVENLQDQAIPLMLRHPEELASSHFRSDQNGRCH